MKCPTCQFENREGAKFCKKCGSKLELSCPSCGRPVQPDSTFCDECGHKLSGPEEPPPIDLTEPKSYTPKFLADKILTTRSAIEGERKLVTVLFADVADYTAISERLDPEVVHQIMDGCFKILMDEIHRCEGTINQFTGDGVMALFGAPVAHEDHAQRACYGALAIQKAMRMYAEKVEKDLAVDFRMRVGLNSGPVVVGSIGDDLRMDYTAVGDTTNLAARMEGMAKPGTVLVSGNTHRLARSFFEFEPLGKLKLKGIREVQEAFELIRASDVETRIEAAVARGLTKFVGRQREMQVLQEAFEKVQSGKGQVVGIVGEAGVGKSRLLVELRNMLPKGRYTYLEGRCLHYGGSMPYLPILDILRTYFDIKEGEGESAVKEKIAEKITLLDERLRESLPCLQEVMALKVDHVSYLYLDPGQKKARTFEALRDLFLRESENRPVVLVVEDLHWIDKTGEEFLDYLIGWLAGTPILLILLYRPEYTHQWGSKSYYSKIGVDQLPPENSLELVQAILEGGSVLPELQGLILNRAGGNPLFVEEITRSLLENGSIEKRDHQYVLTRSPSEIEVPDTIQGIIAARIDRIEENLKQVMQVASVIGREFAFRILQTIMGMKEELKSHLLNLQGLEFISEKRLFPELEYIFKHALTQEVAYNTLLQQRRKEIHERIGETIEHLYPERLEEYCELLVYHYGRGDNKEKTLEYLDRANQKAAKLNALEDARAYFYEAMKLLDTLPDTEENRQRRISMLLNQSFVFEYLFESKEYYALLKKYEPVASELAERKLLGALYCRMADCMWWQGKYDQGIQVATMAAKLAEDSGRADEAQYAYNVLAYIHLDMGNFDKVSICKENVIRLMNEVVIPRCCVSASGAASFANYYRGRWEEAIKDAENALSIGEEYSDRSLISLAKVCLAYAYTAKGDLDRAISYAETSLEKAPTRGDKAHAQQLLAWIWIRAGEPRKGVEILTSMLPMVQASGWSLGIVSISYCLSEGHRLIGEYGRAKQLAEEALRLAERYGMKYYIARLNLELGMVALETNPNEAEAHFEKSISVSREIKSENLMAQAFAGYGRLRKDQGRIEDAREYLTKALEIFERLGTLIDPDKVREELAGLPEG